jgi:hypothetical protein
MTLLACFACWVLSTSTTELANWLPVFVQLRCVPQQQRPHLLTVQVKPTVAVALQHTAAHSSSSSSSIE